MCRRMPGKSDLLIQRTCLALKQGGRIYVSIKIRPPFLSAPGGTLCASGSHLEDRRRNFFFFVREINDMNELNLYLQNLKGLSGKIRIFMGENDIFTSNNCKNRQFAN